MFFYQNTIFKPYFYFICSLSRLSKARAWLVIIILLQFLLVMPPARAVIQMSELYEAEAEVAGQDAKERHRAFKKMFGEVIIRISGSREAVSFPLVISAMKRPERYVLQYQYFQKTVESEINREKITTQISILWSRFDRKAVIELLQKSELPVWQEIRPATLVWLAVDAEDQRYLLENDVINSIREQLDQHAVRRGIPLLYPLMDLEDQQKIGFTDIWGGFSGVIQEASQRYSTAAVLVGRVLRDRNGEWSARWKLVDAHAELHWESGSEQVMDLLGEGVDGLADHLGSLYAVYEGDEIQTQVVLTVSGVHSLQAYARVQKYLNSISIISKQQLIQLEGERLRFRLDLQGKASDLTQAFALKNVLVPDQSIVIDQSLQHLNLQQRISVEYRSVHAIPVTNDGKIRLPVKIFYRIKP